MEAAGGHGDWATVDGERNSVLRCRHASNRPALKSEPTSLRYRAASGGSCLLSGGRCPWLSRGGREPEPTFSPSWKMSQKM